MAELPSGTVTFLFTDIEGSTRLLHELGDAYADALTEHRRALRDAFQRHGGVEVDTQGDAFFVAFARATDALAAAGDGQSALSEGPIRVRMGIHTGEPLVTDEGYVGLDVHRAARIAALGHGGQVLVSQATRELVGADGLLDLGEHRLKDLTAPERIHQLGEGEFPPLKSLNQSTLPVQPTPFVGREKELGEVISLLRQPDMRLLTLTGAGGSGKTRMAVQAAAEVVDDHAHGVWWIPLQEVRDANRVGAAISSALGAGGDLAEYIGARNMLLVLDNFEQVADAAPPVLGELLASSPNLRLLVTSRETLHLAAEREYPVPPLVEQESVGFFLSRARVVRPGFEPDEHVLPICRRVDHLPLALELAAARVKALPTRQILERLDRSLPLLTGGRRDAPERQRTLRGAIAWSYELLSPDEQAAFRRLGVFAGGWTLDAAEEVAGAGLDTIQSLVDKSLVRFDGERYSLLETIREFTLELLQEACELDETRQRHFAFFYALAEAADTSAEGDYGRPQILRREQENMRAALDGAVAAGEITPAVELMVMLENFWVTTNPFEGARRFEELLPHELPERLRARALRCFAGSLWLSGEYERSHRTNEESLALFRSLGDEEGVGVLLHRIGISTMYLGDHEEARRLLDESLRLLRKVGSVRGEAEVIGALAYLLEKEGDPAAAIELFSRAAEMASEIGFTWWRVGMLSGLVECHVQLGRLDEGEAFAREELTLAREIGERQSCVYGLVHLAWIAVLRGDDWLAGVLWGAVETEESRAPVGQWETERDDYVERVTARGAEDFERGRREGRGLSFEAAIEEVLG